MKKRRIALWIALVMMLSLCPSVALADTGGTLQSDPWEAASGETYSYQIYLPENYASSGLRYPSLYLMPKDGYSSQSYLDDGMKAKLDGLMASSSVLDMIVIMPNFNHDDDFRALTHELVSHIDATYRTVASSAQRGIMGVEVGGYMAYIVGFTNQSGDTLSSPDLFTAIGSHMGNFVENDYYDSYGDVYDKLNGLNKTALGKFYTYLDAPTEDPASSKPKGTNDIGALFRSKASYSPFNYDVHEFSSRYGEKSVSFYQSSMARSFNRFSSHFLKGLVGGSLTVSPQAVTSENSSIQINYEFTVKGGITDFIDQPLPIPFSLNDLEDPEEDNPSTDAPASPDVTPTPTPEAVVTSSPTTDVSPLPSQMPTDNPAASPSKTPQEDALPVDHSPTPTLPISGAPVTTPAPSASTLPGDSDRGMSPLSSSATLPAKITVTTTNAKTGVIVDQQTNSVSDVIATGNSSGSFTLPVNSLGDWDQCQITFTLEILGMEFEIESKDLVRVQSTGTAADEQLINLMGDWRFKAYKAYRDSTPNDLDDITNVTKAIWSGTDWDTVQPALGWWTADFATSLGGNPNWAGYAWYVREFDVPASFPTEGLLLTAGMFDEADEIYINGTKVGATGIKDDGTYDGSNPWDVERVYALDSSILQYGQTNTIAVRMCNSSGGGGWYTGPVGIYSMAAYNKALGLPSTIASTELTQQVLDTIHAQNKALEDFDLTAYGAYIDPEYFQSGYTKDRMLQDASELLNAYDSLAVYDYNCAVYTVGDLLLYQAQRRIAGNGATISEESVSYYLKVADGKALLYGEHDRFYVDTFYSQAAGQDVTYRVYLPEGYFNSDQRYPTTYLLHQINSTGKSYEIDKVNEIMDAAIDEGRVRPMIMVIPDSTKTSWWSGIWETMVTEDLVTMVDQNYRTIDDARYRLTAGASMGGYGAYAIGYRHPEKFSSIISFFGALSMGTAANRPMKVAADESALYSQYFNHYFIAGNRDIYSFGNPAIELDRLFREKDVDHRFFIDNGEHDSAFYIPHFAEAFAYVSDRMANVQVDTSVISGDLDVARSNGQASANYKISIKDGISAYQNTIPDSSYTDNAHPDLIVPVVTKVSQHGQVVYSTTAYYPVHDATVLEQSVPIPSTALQVTEPFQVQLFASVLDNTWEVASYQYAPAASSTLTDVDTGITLTGSFDERYTLQVTEVDKATLALLEDHIPNGNRSVCAYEVALLLNGQPIPLPQEATLSFPVEENDNNRDFTILQYSDGNVDQTIGVTADRHASILVTKLSSFMVTISAAHEMEPTPTPSVTPSITPTPSTNVTPLPSASATPGNGIQTGDSFPFLAILLVMVAALGVVVGILIWHRSKHSFH